MTVNEALKDLAEAIERRVRVEEEAEQLLLRLNEARSNYADGLASLTVRQNYVNQCESYLKIALKDKPLL